MRQIILASASPRRSKLLEKTGLSFRVIPADIDEGKLISSLGSKMEDDRYPALVVEGLSEAKAQKVAGGISEGIVIGADTIVWDNEILGKPKDRSDARRMLERIQGGTHSVFTGVTVLEKGRGEKTHCFYRETKVKVCPMTKTEIESYLDTGEPMDKAGAYGIQGQFALWVDSIEGDYNTVVGLPLSALWQLLKGLI